MGKTAIVIGGTGLVGSNLIQQLIQDDTYALIVCFGRRLTGVSHPKLVDLQCDFEDLSAVETQIQGHVLFMCLGTTLKKAGSKAQQFKVDFAYQLAFARRALANNTLHGVLVSSASANPHSRFFYLRMKGELEVALQKLPFLKLDIFQPSGLIGQRGQKRKREVVGIKIFDRFIRVLPFTRKYRAIPAETVARAMLNLSKRTNSERVVYARLDEIFHLAE